MKRPKTNWTQFDFDVVIDGPDHFVRLLYDCKQIVVSRSPSSETGEDSVVVDNMATLIRATKLTRETERVWMYGDNKPSWLISFMDNNADEIERLLRERLQKEGEALANKT